MIVKMTEAHARHVCENLQEVERRERAAGYGRPYDPEWYLPIVMARAENDPAYTCLLLDGTPAVIGGVSLDGDVGVPWMCGTDDIYAVVMELTRACRKSMRALHANGVEKMRVTSADFHTTAHRWYSVLGLTQVGEFASPTNQTFFVFEG